jgi:hypothetical protein
VIVGRFADAPLDVAGKGGARDLFGLAPRPELRRTIEWERRNPPPVNPAMFDYDAEDRAVGARA